jgi:hypothetical protein
MARCRPVGTYRVRSHYIQQRLRIRQVSPTLLPPFLIKLRKIISSWKRSIKPIPDFLGAFGWLAAGERWRSSAWWRCLQTDAPRYSRQAPPYRG